MSDRLFDLERLTAKLKQSLGIIQKQDIQVASKILELQTDSKIQVGDDCAAIADGDGYLLLAAEGIWHVLVERDHWLVCGNGQRQRHCSHGRKSDRSCRYRLDRR